MYRKINKDIYIYIERERERETNKERKRDTLPNSYIFFK